MYHKLDIVQKVGKPGATVIQTHIKHRLAQTTNCLYTHLTLKHVGDKDMHYNITSYD